MAFEELAFVAVPTRPDKGEVDTSDCGIAHLPLGAGHMPVELSAIGALSMALLCPLDDPYIKVMRTIVQCATEYPHSSL